METVDHEATIASHALGVAVYQVLLRVVLEVAGGNLEGTLDSSSGGEGPARSALTLVLHGRDGALLSPVDAVGQVRGVEGTDLGLQTFHHLRSVSKHPLVLEWSDIREGVQAEFVSVLLVAVVGLNLGEAVLELL